VDSSYLIRTHTKTNINLHTAKQNFSMDVNTNQQGAAGKQDYGDKALGMAEKKFGGKEQSASTNEKIVSLPYTLKYVANLCVRRMARAICLRRPLGRTFRTRCQTEHVGRQ